MFKKLSVAGISLLLLGATSLGFTGLASAHAVAHHTSKAKQTAAVEYAHADLKGVGNKSHGVATLTLNTKTHTMTVLLKIWGLAKNSKHPAHIHAYKDGKTGKILYPFGVVHANAKGFAVEKGVFKDVKAIDDKGWIVNIHKDLTDYAVICKGVVVAGK